jgi:Transaldolase/Fructose-6-phosphate aldolase
MGVRGAGILAPVFEREDGRKGRLSLQTNPANYRDPARMADQAVHFSSLAPNIQVKFPTTAAGLVALEEAGGDTSRFSPVCSLMIGRLDDWVKVLVERDDIALEPAAANWAGIAAFKRAYAIYIAAYHDLQAVSRQDVPRVVRSAGGGGGRGNGPGMAHDEAPPWRAGRRRRQWLWTCETSRRTRASAMM